jgi:hypothetical protein
VEQERDEFATQVVQHEHGEAEQMRRGDAFEMSVSQSAKRAQEMEQEHSAAMERYI